MVGSVTDHLRLTRYRLAQSRRVLTAPQLDRRLVICHENESADSKIEYERQQLLDPLLGRPLSPH